MLTVDDHPLLELATFALELSTSLGSQAEPPWVELLGPEGPDLGRSEERRAAVRRLLRYGGFKPSGRSKPASEYLAKAMEEQRLGPINPVVDLGNAASLHSGLPISIVDVDRTEGELRVGIAPPGARFVFNASGQEIDVGGLLGLSDALGPCANAVKDAQRTKTSDVTTRLRVLVWGTVEAPGAPLVAAWMRDQAAAVGWSVGS